MNKYLRKYIYIYIYIYIYSSLSNVCDILICSYLSSRVDCYEDNEDDVLLSEYPHH